MTDPFSVASGAAGIVSLGLTLCQGIAQYYSALKSHSEEVKGILKLSASLTTLLRGLQPCLTKLETTHRDTASQAKECLCNCSKAAEALQKTLRKCEISTVHSDFEEKLRLFKLRTVYPFRRDTLLSLKQTLNDFRGNLVTALDILGLDVLSSLDGKNDLILEHVREIHNQSELILEHSKVVENNTGCMVQSIERTDLNVEVALQHIKRTDVNAQQSLLHVERVEANTGILLQQVEITRDQMQQNAALLAQVMPLLQCVAANPHVLPNGHTDALVSNTSRGMRSRTLQKNTFPRYPRCSCIPRSSSGESLCRIGPIAFVRSDTRFTPHVEGCSYYQAPIESCQYGIRFLGRLSVRKWTAEAALNFNRTVGTFSINSSMTSVAVVPYDHPAVQAIGTNGHHPGEILTQLRSLFNSGQVSGYERTEDGQTLLHHLLSSQLDSPLMHSREGQEEFQEIVEELISRHVPLNEVDECGWTATDYLIDRLFEFTMFGGLAQCMLEQHQASYDPQHTHWSASHMWFNTICMVEIFQLSSDLAKEFGCNELGLAILKRSLSEVQSILRLNPSLLYKRNAFGQTILHLAADWPDGLKYILQQNGATFLVNTEDSNHIVPLDYTFSWESIELLLQYDSQLTDDFFDITQQHIDSISGSKMFLEVLKDRRKRLLELAKRSLDADELLRLNIPCEDPPDGNVVTNLYQALEDNSVVIPGSLKKMRNRYGADPNGILTFERLWRDMNVEKTDFMYQAGFRFNLQWTPLHSDSWIFSNIQDLLATCLWFFDKGVPLTPELLHNVGSHVDKRVWLSWWSDLSYLDQYEEYLLKLLLEPREPLLHGCLCCIDGCNPVVMSLYRCLSPNGYNASHNPDFPEGGQGIWGPESQKRISPAVIRFIVFMRLELTHSKTCCRQHSWIEEDVTKEKQDEEWYLRSKLEPLVEELCTEYGSQETSLWSFIVDVVFPRAQSVFEGDKPTEEHRQSLRELGVVLEEVVGVEEPAKNSEHCPREMSVELGRIAEVEDSDEDE